MGRHGGGAFSGKDPSKVDRSAAYASRWVAKHVVAKGWAERCEVQVAYAIGVAEPVSVRVDSFGTVNLDLFADDMALAECVAGHFGSFLRPAKIAQHFELRRPIYRRTAAYGHFGREDFPWEKLDQLDAMKA
jgi:S-adenosylmethionine synthetase